jgi:AraC family transcriptional activator of tynA and feaB
MSQSFSTELIPVSDRLDAWLWNARQICGDCQFEFHKHHSFHGSIERRKIAGLELTLFSSSALSFRKFPPTNVQPDNRACVIITQLGGVRQYLQGDKVVVLSKGDTTLIDSGFPWSSDCAGDCARLYLRVPRPQMESCLGCSTIPNARRIPGGRGLGATLFHLVTSLYERADGLSLREGAVQVDAYLTTLAACLLPPKAPLGGRRADPEPLVRVMTYIRNHLSEDTLCPMEIASAAGISVRHLHRLFSYHGSTVADWIRTQRLKNCWRDLADPRSNDRSITEIAFFWGFNDSAHFSHSFKREFGVSARSRRSQVSQRRNNPESRDFGHRKPS